MSEPLPRPAPRSNLWLWIPTLYFTQAVPYAMVNFVSKVFYKNMEISNAEIAFFGNLIAWPWVIKPLWSPFVDILRTRRWWILTTQLLLAIGLAGIGFLTMTPYFFIWTLLLFSVIALASATHDIAADGFYMLASTPHEQAFFVGIRSTFYRLGLVACQGLLVVLVGRLEDAMGVAAGWRSLFLLTGVSFLLLFGYHWFALPKPARDKPAPLGNVSKVLGEFVSTFGTFFTKRGIGIILAFILLYRFSEAQLVALKSLFFLDEVDKGGLGLTTGQVGTIDGFVGIIMLLVGGILGGALASRHGLKAWIWWMVLAINVPNLAYIYLATVQPDSLVPIYIAVAIEQFGYGFGFAGYMLYLLYVARGNHETAHYAICTGFMALGIMVPGMWAGKLQELLGYQEFFIWVMFSTIPSFIVVWFIPLDDDFGKKTDEAVAEEAAT